MDDFSIRKKLILKWKLTKQRRKKWREEKHKEYSKSKPSIFKLSGLM